MTTDDVVDAQQIAGAALRALRTTVAPAQAVDRTPTEAEVDRWHRRARHLLEHDPDGCWSAEINGELVGIAMSLCRDKLWGLSGLFVRPDQQAIGVGAALLDAALEYSQGCLSGIIVGTEDPRAARRYRLAGFTLHPTMRVRGYVDRSAIPVIDGVRVGGPGDADLVDSVDRRIRGAARRVDHQWWSREYVLLVCDTFSASGYCYVDEAGSPIVLAATSRAVAQRLLWSALAQSTPDREVHIATLTAAQEWAVDVVLATRLALRTEGYLCLRHLRPPSPYIPSGPFL